MTPQATEILSESPDPTFVATARAVRITTRYLDEAIAAKDLNGAAVLAALINDLRTELDGPDVPLMLFP